MKNLIFIALSLALSSNICFSQNAKMIVEISNDTILMGNHIQLRYTIENASGKFEMPDLEGLILLSGPNTSSSMSMINGVVTQQASYSVYLKPVDIGSWYIGPAFVETDEGILESKPISVVVIDNPKGLQQNSNRLKLLEEVEDISDNNKPKKKKVKRYKI